jgi:hypothetical protein
MRFEPETPDLILLKDEIGRAVVRTYEFRDVVYTETTGRYSALCKGPCETLLRPGHYVLALSKGGRTPATADGVKITGPSALRASYIDRRSQRYLGLAIAVVGLGAGNAMILANTIGSSNDTTVLYAGAATAVVGLVAGAYFGFREDEATIKVVPLEASPRPASTPSVGVPPQAQGIALRVRF